MTLKTENNRNTFVTLTANFNTFHAEDSVNPDEHSLSSEQEPEI